MIRLRGSQVRRLGLLVALSAVFVGSAAGLPAQQATLEDRRLEYRSALREYEAAVAAWRVLEDRWRQATDAFNRARGQVDDGVLDRLESAALQRSRELQAGDLRVAETEARLEEARDALRSALDTRLQELARQFDEARTPAERDAIAALIDDLRNQFVELADPEAEERVLVREIYPAISYDPRDGPTELRAKAELADRQAERAAALIAEIDRELERRREFLRIQRLAGDVRSSLDRFGDPQVPVTSSGGQRSEGGLVQDTTGVVLDDLPPEEAIRALETYRLQLENLRAEMRRRAATFRELIRVEVRP